MKNGETIIHKLFGSNPKYKERRVIRALLAPLPPIMQEAARSARFNGDTLILTLSSQAMKSEYYIKRDQIRSLFKALKRETSICDGFELNNFKFYVDRKSDFIEPKPTELVYEERANGRFENRAANKAVFEAIERARKVILSRAQV
ncbi:MAG: hypothetical protein LBO72_00320 [Helicobacteraceae bacterium]|jgi:hypothetical protein|nr:hypothetical protein [Helicobacteraceae bacterium]